MNCKRNQNKQLNWLHLMSTKVWRQQNCQNAKLSFCHWPLNIRLQSLFLDSARSLSRYKKKEISKKITISHLFSQLGDELSCRPTEKTVFHSNDFLLYYFYYFIWNDTRIWVCVCTSWRSLCVYSRSSKWWCRSRENLNDWNKCSNKLN